MSVRLINIRIVFRLLNFFRMDVELMKDPKLNMQIVNSYDEMSEKAADLIIKQVNEKPESLVCLAAGDSPTGTLKYLVEASKRGKVDFSKCYFVGLDEFVGLSKEDEGSCYHYFQEHFFSPLNISSERIHFFNGKSDDLQGEIIETDNYISIHDGIDVLLLGVGINGHLALNEPGISWDLTAHAPELSETTKIVGQKYFSQKVTLEKGLTIGIKQILESKLAILIANGPKKKTAISTLVSGDLLEDFPVTSLNLHQNCQVIVDKEAYFTL